MLQTLTNRQKPLH